MDNYKRKQEWLERVMASDLNHAEKVFAFAVFTHMYGNKTEAFPASDDLKRAGGFKNIVHFPRYRERLFAIGALTGEKRKHKGQWANYTYRLNLDWDGSTVSHEVITMTPDVSDHDTSGNHHDTSGITNTTNNPPKEDNKEDYKTAVADAPAVPLDSSMQEESFSPILSSPSLSEAKGPTNSKRHDTSGNTVAPWGEW